MAKKEKLVSIVLPTHNGSQYIKDSIDSCLSQTYKTWELIIVDDGSTDNTAQIVRSYTDRRIKYISNRQNKGLPVALNTGFAQAQGAYLTWTSDDNIYLPSAIQEMVTILNSSENRFVFCDFYRFWQNDKKKKNRVSLPGTFIPQNGNTIGPCFMYTRHVYRTVGKYDVKLVLAEDYDYWIRVSRKFSLTHIPLPLYMLRDHPQSLSRSKFFKVQWAIFLTQLKNGMLSFDFWITRIRSYLKMWTANLPRW